MKVYVVYGDFYGETNTGTDDDSLVMSQIFSVFKSKSDAEKYIEKMWPNAKRCESLIFADLWIEHITRESSMDSDLLATFIGCYGIIEKELA